MNVKKSFKKKIWILLKIVRMGTLLAHHLPVQNYQALKASLACSHARHDSLPHTHTQDTLYLANVSKRLSWDPDPGQWWELQDSERAIGHPRHQKHWRLCDASRKARQKFLS